jgi:hypothetical protein
MSVPTAILLGSGLIAASIYLGLRSQVPVAPATASEHPVAVPVPAPVVTPPVSSPELVKQQASEALAYQRTRLRDVCYRPAVLVAGAPLPAAWTLNVTFDAQGNQLVRGVEEHLGTSTPELTRCIGEQTQPMTVPAPGRTIMVEIPLSFP